MFCTKSGFMMSLRTCIVSAQCQKNPPKSSWLTKSLNRSQCLCLCLCQQNYTVYLQISMTSFLSLSCICLCMYARLCLSVGLALSPHLSDQLSERSLESTTALQCSEDAEIKTSFTCWLTYWLDCPGQLKVQNSISGAFKGCTHRPCLALFYSFSEETKEKIWAEGANMGGLHKFQSGCWI